MYAEIAFDIPLNKSFAYAVPPEWGDILAPGHLVEAPFRTSVQAGVVLSLHEMAVVAEPKRLNALLDPEPVVSERQLAAARWMSETSLTPIGMCVWSLLPAGMVMQRDVRVELLDPTRARSPLAREIAALLEKRGPLHGRQLDFALPGRNWRAAVDDLVDAGAVTRQPVLLPPRAKPKQVQIAALSIPPEQIEAAVRGLSRPSKAADALEALASGPMTAAALRRDTGVNEKQLEALTERGWASAEGEVWTTSLRDAALREAAAELRRTARPARILRLLARERVPMDVSWVYAQADAELQDLRRLHEHGLITLGARETWRDSLANREFVPTYAPALTAEQTEVWGPILDAIKGRTPGTALAAEGAGVVFLLQGVTGSGKTELYLRAIAATLAQGRDAIYLVPEIALTAQTVLRVGARFPGEVAIVHSGLSDGERFDTWRRARQGMIHVVVGARSAIFTPLPDVGLIILDEEHDASYQQTGEQRPPAYHARALAEAMARFNDAVVLLGSATPALETRYRADQGHIRRLVLPTRIHAHEARIAEQEAQIGKRGGYRRGGAPEAMTIDLPPVEVVDMRAELKADNRSIFSRSLQAGLAGVLERREQALLLMNRRGQATYVFCRDCGYVAICPRCDAPLTHHREGATLQCHQCGHSEAAPSACPSCGSSRIKFFGAGTQQVEQAVKALFPAARVLRWDADSATTPGAHEAILRHFIDHYADIIVGTQMIAKGLDLPLVTFVGVVSADISLNLPDFRAAERSFQLLTQMAGRAGRGLLGGRVVIQTYHPDHYAIQAAAAHDVEGFYRRELAYRRELGYPPFRRLARILFSHPQEMRARFEAERAAALLKDRVRQLGLTATELIGPAPCFFARVNQQYRWHLIIRSPDPTALLRGLELPLEWRVEMDPMDTL